MCGICAEDNVLEWVLFTSSVSFLDTEITFSAFSRNTSGILEVKGLFSQSESQFEDSDEFEFDKRSAASIASISTSSSSAGGAIRKDS